MPCPIVRSGRECQVRRGSDAGDRRHRCATQTHVRRGHNRRSAPGCSSMPVAAAAAAAGERKAFVHVNPWHCPSFGASALAASAHHLHKNNTCHSLSVPNAPNTHTRQLLVHVVPLRNNPITEKATKKYRKPQKKPSLDDVAPIQHPRQSVACPHRLSLPSTLPPLLRVEGHLSAPCLFVSLQSHEHLFFFLPTTTASPLQPVSFYR